MGIRGLTTYIAKRSDKYLEPYELHDCYLVIDGNSLASQLFCNQSKCNSAFGGDYDLYAHCVEKFFHMLKKCNISPLVVFDGGYELRKWSTVKARLQRKIASAGTVTPVTQSRIKSFPLMMKEAFKDVLKELEVPYAHSLYEADDEIAAIARQLSCPVLSYDSDYFVFDVLYIPFDTLSFELSERCCLETSAPYFISCSIYRVENFLKSFGGLQKPLLPLMAALLGNDYIKRSVFSNFFSQIKKPRSRTMNDTQKSIAGLLQWLRQETFETARSKILNHLKKNDRKYVADQIQKIFAGYVQCSSNLLPLLGLETVESITCNEDVMMRQTLKEHLEASTCEEIEVKSGEDSYHEIEESEICEEIEVKSGEDSCLETEEETVEGDCDSEEEEEETEAMQDEEGNDYSDDESMRDVLNDSDVSFPAWFLSRFQRGEFSTFLVDMITHKTYFMTPMVDDKSLPHAHVISLPLIQVIFGLLVAHQGLPSDVSLTYYARDAYGHPKKFTLTPKYRTASVSFPKIDDLPDLSPSKQVLLLWECLNFDHEDRQAIMELPPQWRLFLISLVFWARNCKEPKINNCHIAALLFCLVSLNIVDGLAGYFRTKKNLLKKKGKIIKKILVMRDSESGNQTNGNTPITPDIESLTQLNLSQLVTSVSHDDCLLLVETLFPFHQMEAKLKTSIKLFSSNTVHAFAQFQSCLFHIMQLNALLNYPFQHCEVARFYSGLFVYNAFINFKKRSDLLAYIMLLLSQAPSVGILFSKLYVCMMDRLTDISQLNKCSRKRHKSKAKCKTNESDIEANAAGSNAASEEEFIDANNKFSALSMVG